MRTINGYPKGKTVCWGYPALLEKITCMEMGEEQHENQGYRGKVLMASERASLEGL